MWAYEKKLQYPVKIKNPNPLYAKIIVSQLGSADGELGAAMRYLNQRYTMPYGDIIGILTDVGTETKRQPSKRSSYSFLKFSHGKNLPPHIRKQVFQINCSFFQRGQRKIEAFPFPSNVRNRIPEFWFEFH